MTLLIAGRSSGTVAKTAPKPAPPKPSSPSGLRGFPFPGAGFQVAPPPKPPAPPRTLAPTSSGGAGFLLTPQPKPAAPSGPLALAPTSGGGAGFLLTPQSGSPTNSQVPNPAESTPKVPQIPASTVGTSPQAQPAPLDQTAMANIAAYLNRTNNSMAGLGVQGTADQARYQTSVDALRQQNPLADLRLMTAANDRGGFYGSAYGQQLGNLNQQYQSREGGLYSALQGQLQDIAARMAGYQSSIPAYESEQAAAAAQRLAALASNAPAPPAAPAPTPQQLLAENNPPVLPGGNAGVLKVAATMPAGYASGSVAGPVGGFRYAGAPAGTKPLPASKAPAKVPARQAPKAKPKVPAKPGTFHLVRG